MTPDGITVRLDGVSKTWPNGRKAVADLDWTWRAGKLTVLVGASGSGKTTTLRLVAGLEAPTSGNISFDGVDQAACAPHERQVALVPQSPGLFPQWTVRQNMEGNGGSVKRDKLTEVAHFLEIETLLDRYPGEISGGEQQRVSLGRAILRPSRLWLMDEPLGQLDGWLRHQVRRLLREWQREFGVTTLVVTHDPDEAFALADDLAVMDGGRLLQVGTPAEVYERPANLAVAKLFGRGGMNLWWGELVGGEFVKAGWRLKSDQGTGRKVWLGVRAEDLHIGELSGKAIEFGEGVVTDAREFFGPRQLIVVRMKAGEVFCRVEVRSRLSLNVGDEVRLAVDPERLHWFAAGMTDGDSVRIEKLEQFEQSN